MNFKCQWALLSHFVFSPFLPEGVHIHTHTHGNRLGTLEDVWGAEGIGGSAWIAWLFNLIDVTLRDFTMREFTMRDFTARAFTT